MLTLDPSNVVPALHFLSVAGLTVFAMSGALAAARQRLDIVAAGFFAVVTATGGGTVRDLLIGAPVFWRNDWMPIAICIVAAVAVWLVPLNRWPARMLDWFDAAGLSAFAVYGAAKAVEVGVSPLPAVAMGVVTACLGGIIRDMVANVPSHHASQRIVRDRRFSGRLNVRGLAASRLGSRLLIGSRNCHWLHPSRRRHPLEAGITSPSRLTRGQCERLSGLAHVNDPLGHIQPVLTAS